MDLAIPLTRVTVQGTEIREGSGFLSLEGDGSGVLTEEGMVEISKRITGVFKGTKGEEGHSGKQQVMRQSQENEPSPSGN